MTVVLPPRRHLIAVASADRGVVKTARLLHLRTRDDVRRVMPKRMMTTIIADLAITSVPTAVAIRTKMTMMIAVKGVRSANACTKCTSVILPTEDRDVMPDTGETAVTDAVPEEAPECITVDRVGERVAPCANIIAASGTDRR